MFEYDYENEDKALKLVGLELKLKPWKINIKANMRKIFFILKY